MHSAFRHREETEARLSNDFAELCETIADAKAVSDGTAVELRCKPIASIDSGFFIMGEDGSSDTLKVYFTVVFSEPVTDFDDADDVEITGDAGGTKTVAITPVGSEGKEYNVAISGMTDGTVIASIPCGKALGQSGIWNYESTSTDNSVLFDDVPPDTPTNAFLDLIVRSTGRIHTKWTTSPSSDVTAVALSAISAWSIECGIARLCPG